MSTEKAKPRSAPSAPPRDPGHLRKASALFRDSLLPQPHQAGLEGLRPAGDGLEAALDYAEALYLGDAAPLVLRACESADPVGLRDLPPLAMGRDMVRISLDYCPRCGKAGVLSARIETPKREKKPLAAPRALPTEAIANFLPLLKKAHRVDPLELGDRG